MSLGGTGAGGSRGRRRGSAATPGQQAGGARPAWRRSAAKAEVVRPCRPAADLPCNALDGFQACQGPPSPAHGARRGGAAWPPRSAATAAAAGLPAVEGRWLRPQAPQSAAAQRSRALQGPWTAVGGARARRGAGAEALGAYRWAVRLGSQCTRSVYIRQPLPTAPLRHRQPGRDGAWCRSSVRPLAHPIDLTWPAGSLCQPPSRCTAQPGFVEFGPAPMAHAQTAGCTRAFAAARRCRIDPRPPPQRRMAARAAAAGGGDDGRSVWALDFDGVACDSVGESSLSAFKVCRVV